MATTTLEKREGRSPGYEYSATVLDGVTGPSVLIPPMGAEGAAVTCTIIAGASTGKIQFTTSPDADVIADTANWQDWPNGNTTGTYSDALISPISAVRGVSISGDIDIEILV